MKKVLSFSLIVSVALLIYTILFEYNAWIIGLFGVLTGWSASICIMYLIGNSMQLHQKQHIEKLEKDMEEFYK